MKMFKKATALTLALTIMSPLLSFTAAAQIAPQSDDPIDITGETLEFNENIATWTGNVRALQGNAILTATKLVAVLDDKGDFKTITATGDMRYSNGKEIITGQSGIYDAGSKTISVSEKVVVTQGDQVMTGGALIYWVDSGKIRLTSPGGNRIRGLFFTKQNAPNS